MTATEHRMHGLAGDAIVPDWPPLQTAEVRALIARYPHLRGPCTLTWHSPRPFSAAARVATGAGEVFIKRHHVRVRTAPALAEEHAFIAHLRAHGVPLPAVLADSTGQTAISHGEWTYEVHALADGIDRFGVTPSWTPLIDLDLARTAGRMLAQLHQAAVTFPVRARRATTLVARDALLRAEDLVAAIDSQCQRNPALADYLARRDWRTELAPLLPRQRALQPRLAGMARCWTHNDWHVSNLCWTSLRSDAQVSAILDVGLAAPTFALYDLATAIERNAIAWLQLDAGHCIGYPDTARALIAGYAERLPLDAGQRALLADVLPLVHLDFALAEVAYFHGITGHTADADVAWHTFLLGHAAWFETAPGRALLAAVRGS